MIITIIRSPLESHNAVGWHEEDILSALVT